MYQLTEQTQTISEDRVNYIPQSASAMVTYKGQNDPLRTRLHFIPLVYTLTEAVILGSVVTSICVDGKTNKVRSEGIAPILESHSLLLLRYKYENEKTRHSFINEKADKLFLKLSTQLSTLDFQKVDVEITPSHALKFIFVFENEKVLMVSKAYDSAENNKVIFSLFINRELIITDASDIDSFTEGMQKFLSV